ncbi:M15 family metallopeptidase [Zhihengliuella flava]|uniref:D-alanyl-D-alanine carboxypeptidase n=1 Tax=Zhihengliuella flava TaxID=1285193 RepID=A0A931GL88_9MICC|nr:M15 family metallopeptidase [Zhihengliuella flava]MBG6084229.1 D-alanyl-D-alanine carboxypeptidase [Zhihengliuella flava]
MTSDRAPRALTAAARAPHRPGIGWARALGVGAVGLGLAVATALPAAQATPEGSSTTTPAAVVPVDAEPALQAGQAPHVEDLSDPSSLAAIANPARPLDPLDYAPEELEPVNASGDQLVPVAAEATRQLLDAAAEAGHPLRVESGYRSYERQSELFASYAASYGAEYASRISAEPGTSEHQLGLAVDVALANGYCTLQACFGDTPAGQWVAEHAEDFGFILRYPEGATETTGYAYEPWHLRYVGAEIVADFAASQATTYEDYAANLEAAADLVAEPLPEVLPGQAPLRLDVTDRPAGLLRLPDELRMGRPAS